MPLLVEREIKPERVIPVLVTGIQHPATAGEN
jgi:hypothetical protein